MGLQIDLLPDFVKKIKDSKTTFVKKFTTFEKIYDFNSLLDYIEKNDPHINPKNNGDFFKAVFQLKQLENQFDDFKFYQNFLREVFKYKVHEKDGCDVFFSFKSGSGNSHIDEEDVFIIGLNGKTLYKVFEDTTKYYEIDKGDMIFIPKGTPHKVISLSSRIILSVGFFGKND